MFVFESLDVIDDVCHSRGGGNPEHGRLDSRLHGNDEDRRVVYGDVICDDWIPRLRGYDDQPQNSGAECSRRWHVLLDPCYNSADSRSSCC